MRIKLPTFLITLILAVSCFALSSAQNRKVHKADKSFKELKYVNAQKIYLQVVERGFVSEDVYARLGDSYYFNANYNDALTWYGKLFKLNPSPKNTWYYLRYSQVLKANGKSALAQKYYDLFIDKTGREDQTPLRAEDYLTLIKENDNRYEFEKISELYDKDKISFGHTVYDGHLYYASTYDQPASFFNAKDGWTGKSFLSLFKVGVDSSNQVTGDPKLLRGVFKNRFHDSSPAFTKDGNTVYFTRNNTDPSEKGEEEILKIYRSHKINGKWQTPEDLNINSDTYSTAHPALSYDEKKLYFSSNREGGRGQSDLYVVDIHRDGSMGRVENLGAEINTAGREAFPYITDQNELYFSSDGHFGLGGMDVFYVQLKEDGSPGSILNVGRPINSNADDFAFGINGETKYGFVSSNRSDQDSVFIKGNIYTFKELTPIKDVYKAKIEGFVFEEDTEDPIKEAQVTLLNNDDMKPYKQLKTDEKGHYKVVTNRFDTYLIRAQKEGYDSDEKQSEPRLKHQRIDLHLKSTVLKPNTDLADLLNIIHFDFDKYNIRPDAEVELQKIVALLQEYPEVRINIRAHTDSRGDDAYNKILSEKRAEATYQYLVDEGIDKSRLEYEGLGETELLNECSNGVPCSKEKHQANRRSEFIVLDPAD